MEYGYIYIAINSHIKHLVKIGFTNRSPDKRLQELSQPTGVPGKFSKLKAWEVRNAPAIEKRIFSVLSARRVDNSEFFKYDDPHECVGDVESLLKNWGEIDCEGVTIPEKERRARAEKESQRIANLENNRKQAISAWKILKEGYYKQSQSQAEKEVGVTLAELSRIYKKYNWSILDYIPVPLHWISLLVFLFLSIALYGIPLILAVVYFLIREDNPEKQKAIETERRILSRRDIIFEEIMRRHFMARGFLVESVSGDNIQIRLARSE